MTQGCFVFNLEYTSKVLYTQCKIRTTMNVKTLVDCKNIDSIEMCHERNELVITQALVRLEFLHINIDRLQLTRTSAFDIVIYEFLISYFAFDKENHSFCRLFI